MAEVLAAAAIVIEIAALFVCPPDVTETFPTTVPAVVGVPVMRPDDALSDSPPGRPVATNVGAGAAGATTIVNDIAVPTVPVSVLELVTTGVLAAGRIVSPSAAGLLVPAALVATSCTTKLPGAVGVPPRA